MDDCNAWTTGGLHWTARTPTVDRIRCAYPGPHRFARGDAKRTNDELYSHPYGELEVSP
jgi:hypothetical protein